MTCTVTARNRVRAAAERLGALPTVAGVDVLAPGTGPREGWSLEATCHDPPAGRLLHALAVADLGLVDVTPRAGHYVLTAVA